MSYPDTLPDRDHHCPVATLPRPRPDAPCALPAHHPTTGRLLPVVLGAFPADGDPCHRIGAENKHATLAYFGNDVPRHAYPALLSSLASTARTHAPFEVDVTGAGHLGTQDALVWFTGHPVTTSSENDQVDGGPLHALRRSLLADPDVRALHDDVDQFPVFVPHVTVGYPHYENGSFATVAERAEHVTTIRFDRLFLWWGPHTVELPLTGSVHQPTR